MSRRSRIKICVCNLITILVMIGCRSDDPKPKIGVSVPITTPTLAIARSAMTELAEDQGFELVWNGVRDSRKSHKNLPVLERRQIRQLRDNRISALIFTPIMPETAYGVFKDLTRRDQSIPIISIDKMLSGISTFGHIEVDEIGLGKIAAEFAVERIGKTANVLILEGEIGDARTRQIAIGIYQILDQYPKIRLHIANLKLDKKEAIIETDRILSAYAENIQAVIAVDSVLSVGAVEAISLRNSNDLVLTIGVGCGEEAIKKILDGDHDAEIDTQLIERYLIALRSAISATNGDTFQFDTKLKNGEIMLPTKFSPARVITPTNVSELKLIFPHLFD